MLGDMVLLPVFMEKQLDESELSILSMTHARKILMSDSVIILHDDFGYGNHTKAEKIFAEANCKLIRLVNMRYVSCDEDSIDKVVDEW